MSVYMFVWLSVSLSVRVTPSSLFQTYLHDLVNFGMLLVKFSLFGLKSDLDPTSPQSPWDKWLSAIDGVTCKSNVSMVFKDFGSVTLVFFTSTYVPVGKWICKNIIDTCDDMNWCLWKFVLHGIDIWSPSLLKKPPKSPKTYKQTNKTHYIPMQE